MPTHRWGDYTPSGHLGRILDDKTPQLGGMLDGNGFTFNGAVAFEAQAGEALSKGNAVYVSGVSGNKPVVMKADADDAAKMPAFGIAETDANLNANVNVVTFGTVYEIDTSAYSAGDELYVSTTAGALTATKPTGATTKLQNIGKVIRSHASAGSIKVGGAGRTNAVPNLDNGTVFIGDSNNQAEQRALVEADISDFGTYLTAESDTLDSVTDRGATTTNAITVGNLTSTGIDDNASSTALTISSAGASTFSGDVILSESTPRLDLFDTDITDSNFRVAMAGGTTYIRSRGATGSYGQLRFQRNNDGSTNLSVFGTTTGGDVLFYDDDGSTEGMRWDASANRLGIGVQSPSKTIDISSGAPSIRLRGTSATETITDILTSGTNDQLLNIVLDAGNAGTSPAFLIKNYTTELLRLTSAGNLGISTGSPESMLQVGHATTVDSDAYITFGKRVTSTETNLPFIGQDDYDGGSHNDLGIGVRSTNGTINFYTGNVAAFTAANRRMSIEANGNVTIANDVDVAGNLAIGTSSAVARLSVNAGGSPDAQYGIANFAAGSGVDSYVTVSRGGNDQGGIKILRGSVADLSIYVNSAESSIINYNGGDTSDGLFFRRGSAGTDVMSLNANGDVDMVGSLTVGDGSSTASHIAIKPADDTDADDLQFYNGTTRIGEIGTQDTTWLRINQETAKNIYTPRYIRADGGFFVDGTAKGINGSGNFIGGTVTTPSLTAEVASGPAIYIKDTSGTGATNHNSWISFRDSGNTELGYVGYGSGSNTTLSVSNYGNGPVSLGGTAIIMGATVQIPDANTTISEGSGNALRFSTNSGYVDVGPMNTSFCHFQTDRATFYFNTTASFDGGGIRAYDNSADARFPIYYDSQDTSYYCDPASTSRFNISYNNETSHIAESGRGVKFWNSDSYKIYMSSIANATWGGDVPGSNASDYAMYFRMSSGTNRGFIFRNNTINVAKIDGNGVYSGSGVFGTGQYLDVKYNATGGGGIRLYDSESVLQGYWYGNGAGEHGLLDNDGAWAVRIRTGTNQLRLQTNNNNECMIYTSYVRAVGSCRSPIFYDFNNTSYYAHLDSTGDSIRAAGDIVAYYSDERLKDIEGPIENALDKVSTLNGFYYRGNEKAQKLGYDDKLKVGLSAQEVQKVLPEVIKSCPADNQYMTLDYSKVVPLLVEAIKELKSEIEELKK